jgi:hypothetical protein
LCHAQSRCPNRLAKTSLLTRKFWSGWKIIFNDSNVSVCKLHTSNVAVNLNSLPKMTYPVAQALKQGYGYSWYYLKGNTLKFVEMGKECSRITQ